MASLSVRAGESLIHVTWNDEHARFDAGPASERAMSEL